MGRRRDRLCIIAMTDFTTILTRVIHTMRATAQHSTLDVESTIKGVAVAVLRLNQPLKV